MNLSYSVQEPQYIVLSKAYVDTASDAKIRNKIKSDVDCALWGAVFLVSVIISYITVTHYKENRILQLGLKFPFQISQENINIIKRGKRA